MGYPAHSSVICIVYRRIQCILSIFLLFAWNPRHPSFFAHAKIVSGNVRLSGKNSERLLVKFALSPYAQGTLDVVLSSHDMYENEQSLKIHIYRDTQWADAQRAQTCTDTIRYAQRTLPVSFNYDNHNPSKDEVWRAVVQAKLHQEEESRTHYYYIVLDDCSLEWMNRDKRIPHLHYETTIRNDVGGNQYRSAEQVGDGANAEMQEPEKIVQLTHLSADEASLSSLHSITMILSSIIAVSMALVIFNQIVDTRAVHAALFLVMFAAGCDAASSFCELVHRSWYERNGHGWYFFDAMSSHFEAMCDSLVSLTLLSMAAGWTLPSDVVPVPTMHNTGHGTFLQSLIQGFRNPMGALVSFGPAGILAFVIILTHGILAQWGRTYDDDFDAYHALEHMPGRLLMLFRMVLGLLMILATVQTRQHCPASLQSFYMRFSIVGTLWFQSLPLVAWTCSRLVPYYLRHVTVALYGSLVQSASLVALAWLVTSHAKDSFHKMSRLGNPNANSLTDELSMAGGDMMRSSMSSSNGSEGNRAAPRTWTIMGKAKIRLD